MILAARLFVAVAPIAFASDPRRVRWYLANRAELNDAFVTEHADAITGVYMCCNTMRVDENGNVTVSMDHAAAAAPMLAKGLTYHAIATPDGVGIRSGAARRGAREVVQRAREANITGVIFDYEPSSNYTLEHKQAYADFLRAVKMEAGSDVEVGMDTAGWGILEDAPIFAEAGLDVYTSMTPTYNQPAAMAPKGIQFVKDQLGNFTAAHYSAGLGSMPASGSEEKCANMGGPDGYQWTEAGMDEYLPEVSALGLQSLDVWRCDIDGYGTVAPWFIDRLAGFLAGRYSDSVI